MLYCSVCIMYVLLTCVQCTENSAVCTLKSCDPILYVKLNATKVTAYKIRNLSSVWFWTVLFNLL